MRSQKTTNNMTNKLPHGYVLQLNTVLKGEPHHLYTTGLTEEDVHHFMKVLPVLPVLKPFCGKSFSTGIIDAIMPMVYRREITEQFCEKFFGVTNGRICNIDVIDALHKLAGHPPEDNLKLVGDIQSYAVLKVNEQFPYPVICIDETEL